MVCDKFRHYVWALKLNKLFKKGGRQTFFFYGEVSINNFKDDENHFVQ